MPQAAQAGAPARSSAGRPGGRRLGSPPRGSSQPQQAEPLLPPPPAADVKLVPVSLTEEMPITKLPRQCGVAVEFDDLRLVVKDFTDKRRAARPTGMMVAERCRLETFLCCMTLREGCTIIASLYLTRSGPELDAHRLSLPFVISTAFVSLGLLVVTVCVAVLLALSAQVALAASLSVAGLAITSQKALLDGVSGRFRPGELVAVLGPSGAGKTTLLNIISGYMHCALDRGSVRLARNDGRPVTRRVSCYLPQDDQVQGLFTARETVMQAVDLKIGSRLSNKARNLAADEMIEMLGLSQCANTRASALSGGQRRRLSLAAELVDNPAVIFLDEPTTGLDTSTALHCVSLLRRLARSGRTVICTIHQPSESMLTLFDQMFVMARGRCAFRGRPADIVPFLSEMGFVCPNYHNPADFLLEVVSGEYGDISDALVKAMQSNGVDYPPPLPDLDEKQEAGGKGLSSDAAVAAAAEQTRAWDSHREPSELERFRTLVARCLLHQHRDWVTTHLKLGAAVVCAFMLSLLYGVLGNDGSRTITNASMVFIVSVYISYTSEAPAAMKYADEVPIIKKEWFNNWYRLKTYSIALLISSLPLHVMTCTLMCSIVYYMTGQIAEPLRFAQFTIIFILTSVVAESVGLQIGSFFLKRRVISLFIAAIHLAYTILFSGFLALKPEMPAWFIWATYPNHLRYSMDGAIVSLYKDRARLACPEEVLYCHFREPSVILKTFGLFDMEFWPSIIGLVVIASVFRITGFLCLRRNVKCTNV